MIYSNSQLEKIKEYASLLMRPSHIALLLDLDAKEFRDDLRLTKHPAHIAYEKGIAETLLEYHRQEINLSKLGSPTAVELVHKFRLDQIKDQNA